MKNVTQRENRGGCFLLLCVGDGGEGEAGFPFTCELTPV